MNIPFVIPSDIVSPQSNVYEATRNTRPFMISGQAHPFLSGAAIMQIREYAGDIIKMEMLKEYVVLLDQLQIKLLKLAFDDSSNEIRVWAEINDDDEEAEFGLVRAESIVNSKFLDGGIEMNALILEKRDRQPVPPQYKPLEFTA